MDRAELLDELTADVLAYVMHGSLPERPFVEEIRPTGLDERFDDFDSLVGLHFVLRSDIVGFVERLPTRLRAAQTRTETVRSRGRGQADGRIDWPATVRERRTRVPGDRSLFIRTDRTEDYDIPENIVLKRLLAVVYDVIRDCEEQLRFEYEWVTDRWRENLELVDRLIEIVERSVHVTRIREPSSYEPTERMLRTAEQARTPLYREAAELLREYEAARRGEPAAIRKLLDETAITPDDDETLLELFVLLKHVRAIEELRDEEFQLRTVESGTQEVAAMGTEDGEIVLYHDRSGRDRGLSFVREASGAQTDELGRAERIKREAQAVSNRYFEGEQVVRRSGRPDVIVLEVRSDQSREYLVTEVKNSSRTETVHQGIEETLEYLAFLRDDGEFVFDENAPFGSGWNGLLVTQDLDAPTCDLSEQRSIRILQASEVSDRLKSVLDRTVM